MNTAQAAELLGVSRQYVRDLCHDGMLECIKLSREWIIPRAAVEKYQRTRRPPGRPPISRKEH